MSHEVSNAQPFALYVHIPYCYQKCPYCDFNTYALARFPEREYVSALLSELDYRASLPEWSGRPVHTIYFGGGTPSVFSAATYRLFINHVRERFSVHPSTEVSLEANPGSLPSTLLEGYRSAGINRISLGVQSLNPQTLKALGRVHTPEQVEISVSTLREVGFDNINIDLIFGAPDQLLEDLIVDLGAVIALAPEHVSPYGLTIEKGTPFFTSHARGILKLPPEDAVVAMMTEIKSHLNRAGYAQYEISNFARPGYEAKHNLAYWERRDYLGLGAGAHSYVRSLGAHGRRWASIAKPESYCAQVVSQGHAEGWNEELTPRAAMFEFFFLGLRRLAGVSLGGFAQEFGVSVDSAYPGVVDTLVSQGYLARSVDTLALTPLGVQLSDSVVEHFSG
jgi:oxygen-independent coproporphyrinogen-3 oxidase